MLGALASASVHPTSLRRWQRLRHRTHPQEAVERVAGQGPLHWTASTHGTWPCSHMHESRDCRGLQAPGAQRSGRGKGCGHHGWCAASRWYWCPSPGDVATYVCEGARAPAASGRPHEACARQGCYKWGWVSGTCAACPPCCVKCQGRRKVVPIGQVCRCWQRHGLVHYCPWNSRPHGCRP